MFKNKIFRGIFLAVLLLVLLAAGKIALLPSKFIPEEFSRTRIEGSKLAEEIVAQSNYSVEILGEIAKLDLERRYIKALDIVSKEVGKNYNANSKATNLSSLMASMARTIVNIQPYAARQLALEAVSSEVSLVSHLINYNNYLAELFRILENKFESNAKNSNGGVQELIKAINGEVKEINDLNEKFNDSLRQFDELFL